MLTDLELWVLTDLVRVEGPVSLARLGRLSVRSEAKDVLYDVTSLGAASALSDAEGDLDLRLRFGVWIVLGVLSKTLMKRPESAIG